MMPVMDGIALCNNVKTNIHTSHIPVVLLTAKTSIDDTLTGLLSDADAYIPKPFSIELLIANCQMLIRNRAKLWQQYLHLNKVDEQSADNLDTMLVKKLIEVVKNNMNNENATVEAISFELGMSRSNLHRKVKAITGKSVTEFSRSIRLAEGAQLLLQDRLQVSEIAFEVGFNSVSYFIRSFKEEYKLTPSQYKSTHLKWK